MHGGAAGLILLGHKAEGRKRPRAERAASACARPKALRGQQS